MGGAVWGVCAQQLDCTTRMNGGYVLCGNTPDTLDCTGQPGTACCLSYPDGGSSLPSSYCAASCPAGTPPACNGTSDTCPNAGMGWTCTPIPGVPIAALGACVPTPDGGGEAGATDGATDAPAD
jgi:hypothetical protein